MLLNYGKTCFSIYAASLYFDQVLWSHQFIPPALSYLYFYIVHQYTFSYSSLKSLLGSVSHLIKVDLEMSSQTFESQRPVQSYSPSEVFISVIYPMRHIMACIVYWLVHHHWSDQLLERWADIFTPKESLNHIRLSFSYH